MEIQEAYVSYKMSKLLKNKGFDEPCHHYYSNRSLKFDPSLTGKNSYQSEDVYSAPTQQMAMQWLREVHDLNINNELSIHGYFCSISHIVRDSLGYIVDVEDSESWETAYYDTHEEACEAAIKYCLENLI